MKARAKAVAGAVIATTGLHRHLLAPHGVIVAFHRIDDRYQENAITYGVRQFRHLCLHFKRHFDVVSLSSFLDHLEAGRSVTAKLVITFDDGYMDNATVAAPILKDLSLPATFFVATGFIGTDRVPWWDREAGIGSEWMTWGDVRNLRDMGFDLGVHTVNHADLGRLGVGEAREELVGAQNHLERETGIRSELFAFPYGREENLSEENRSLVRTLGFRCAPSCYGGTVPPGADPYRLRRVPINGWYRSPGQFTFDLIRL